MLNRAYLIVDGNLFFDNHYETLVALAHVIQIDCLKFTEYLTVQTVISIVTYLDILGHLKHCVQSTDFPDLY